MRVPPKIRRLVIGIIALVLVVSVGLNLYDHFVILPQTKATANNLRVEALDGWIGKVELVKNLLKDAETNFDVIEARVHASWAKRFVAVFIVGIDIFGPQEELYYWVHKATFYLYEGLYQIYFGNQTGRITERTLDPNILLMIANLTEGLGNITSRTEMLLSPNGVEPAQQLREAGVLTPVLRHLEEVYEVSLDMYNYYE